MIIGEGSLDDIISNKTAERNNEIAALKQRKALKILI